MGNANNFHGIQRSRKIALKGCGLGWKSFHCCLFGEPLPRKGSRSAVACWLRSGMVPLVVTWVISLPSFSGSLLFGSDVLIFSPEVAAEVFASPVMLWMTSLGCGRCPGVRMSVRCGKWICTHRNLHFVSGNIKITISSDRAMSPVLNHQKFLHPRSKKSV